jgi:hypothetical protein
MRFKPRKTPAFIFYSLFFSHRRNKAEADPADPKPLS